MSYLTFKSRCFGEEIMGENIIQENRYTKMCNLVVRKMIIDSRKCQPNVYHDKTFLFFMNSCL